MKKLTLIMILGSLLASCGLFDSGVEWRGGPYELAWIDIPDDVYVARVLGNGNSLGRIDARVFAVGWDGRYLVAQQHPQGDKRITNYYIIDSFRDNESADASKVLIGPLSETEFKKKSALLRLPGFTKILPSLK